MLGSLSTLARDIILVPFRSARQFYRNVFTTGGQYEEKTLNEVPK